MVPAYSWLDGQWGFVLPDDRKEFEQKASELGL